MLWAAPLSGGLANMPYLTMVLTLWLVLAQNFKLIEVLLHSIQLTPLLPLGGCM